MAHSSGLCSGDFMQAALPDTSTKSPIKKTLFADSSLLLDDMDALRRRAENDGFLFFRDFLPADEVLAVRRDMLSVMEKFGWREQGLHLMDCRVLLDKLNEVPDSEMREDIGVSRAAYQDVQRLESLHRLPHHPKLLALFHRLFDSELLVHPRHIARMITGHRVMTPTPPHQDFPLIQGTVETWTSWMPMGDCPRELGGLTFLKGSHRLGYLPIQHAKGAGGLAVRLCPWENEWCEGDYRTGDIVIFPSHTVHKGQRCLEKDAVRLSLDVRYQSVREPVEERSLQPHCPLAWEEIYRNWRSQEYQYYWRKQTLRLVPFDDAYQQPGRRIC
jgi:hypothetical protein